MPKETRELGNVHIVTVQHSDPASTETVTKIGVNKEPTFRAANLTEKVAGTRIRIVEEQDTDVQHDSSGTQIADKIVRQIQQVDGDSTAGVSPGSSSRTANPTPAAKEPQPDTPKAPEGPSALQVLKNFVDNVAADVRGARADVSKVRDNQMVLAILAGAGVVGVAIAIAALVVAVVK